MTMRKYTLTTAAAAAAITLGLLGSGCATKKHVAAKVAPIEAKLSELDKRSGEQGTAIDDLDKGLSRTKENVTDLDGRLANTSQEAKRAGEQAAQAGAAAADARGVADKGVSLAEKGLGRVDDVERAFENRDNYQLSKSESILFAFGRKDLNAQAKTMLDDLAKGLDNDHYVVEVQGFTDRTGAPSYNIQLSQRRAEEVVRYLAINHKIPMRKIHVMGAGTAMPVADNKTREGRRMNRRVEVRVYLPETGAGKRNLAASTSQ